MKQQIRIVFALIFVAAVVPFTGCGKGSGIPGLVRCEGTVLWNGTPVEGARVGFNPRNPDGRSAFAVTNSEGKFKATTLNADDGILPGDYFVTVTKVTLHRELLNSGGADRPLAKTRDSAGPPEERMTQTYHIPQVYSNKQTSGLTATIPSKGTRDLLFELVGEIEQ